MPLHVLNEQCWFPPVDDALPDGLLAIGGDVSPARLLLAYRKGIFPWFEGEVPMWWSPDPRFVLYPSAIRISKSMKALLKKEAFEFTMDTAFEQVIDACSHTPRNGQSGTWITEALKQSLIEMYKLGFAHSAEVWQQNKLVGGLYGIRMKQFFFGESMFSHVSNASKYAFIRYVDYLRKDGVELIDCQVHTQHLESLGACMIDRADFLKQLLTL